MNNTNKENNNIDLQNLFMPLMSQTLHLLGQNSDIETIKTNIYQLVEQTQIKLKLTAFDNPKIQTPNNNNKSFQLIKKAQFAIFAWIDEKILTSGLENALLWNNYSLQNTYFNTSEAGYLFYKNLDDILTTFFDIANTNINDLITNGNNYNYQLMISEKLEKLTTQLSTINNYCAENDYCNLLFNTIKIYSLCILYGFIGIYYNDENTLKSLRHNAYCILHNNAATNIANFDFLTQQQQSFYNKNYLLSSQKNIIPKKYIELVLYIVIPIIFCIIFAIFSADLLTKSPINI